MNVVIDMRKSDRKDLIEGCITVFMRELKLEKSKSTLIVFSRKDFENETGAAGMVYPYSDGLITMELDSRLGMDKLIHTIAHEMGHLALKHKFGKNVSVQTARQYELQADVYGAKLAYKCGYDPKQAFAEMTAAEKRARTQSTATHPDYQTRKTHVQQQTGIPVAAINTLQHNKMAIRNFMMA